jgi:hypothetical protein
MYTIKDYSYNKATELGFDIKPSTRKHKKIDIYKDGDYITSIGDNRYLDYPTYLEQYGEDIANYRRNLYHKRHKRDLKINGILSKIILW